MIEGQLRLDRAASPPWNYRGRLSLPSGRTATIQARVAQDAAGKFFELRAAMQPGMSDTELETALAEVERDRAATACVEIESSDSDELPF